MRVKCGVSAGPLKNRPKEHEGANTLREVKGDVTPE